MSDAQDILNELSLGGDPSSQLDKAKQACIDRGATFKEAAAFRRKAAGFEAEAEMPNVVVEEEDLEPAGPNAQPEEVVTEEL